MTARTRAVGALGVAAMVTTLVAAMRDTGLDPGTEWAVVAVGSMTAGVALGTVEYRRGDGAFTDSLAAAVAFWGLFWALFVQAMAALSGGDGGAGALTAVVPVWAVVGGWATLVLVAVGVGGVNPRLRPSNWRAAFREGRER
ncbi:MAG: hypothetical protein ABEJ68_02710 [Halobacteriaceae archaeon]